MVRCLDHIGVLTEDADPLVETLTALGLSWTHESRDHEENYRVVFLGPEPYLELIEPLGPGIVDDLIAERGTGCDHVAFRVESLSDAVARFRDAGLSFREDEPIAGAGRSRIIHLSEAHTGDVLVELVALEKGDFRVTDIR